MPSTHTMLSAIGSTTPVAWTMFIHELPDRPHAYTDKSGWKEILSSLNALEAMELVTVVRDGNSNQVISLALTELGVERLRESIESDRLAIERRKNRIELDKEVRRRYV